MISFYNNLKEKDDDESGEGIYKHKITGYFDNSLLVSFMK